MNPSLFCDYSFLHALFNFLLTLVLVNTQSRKNNYFLTFCSPFKNILLMLSILCDFLETTTIGSPTIASTTTANTSSHSGSTAIISTGVLFFVIALLILIGSIVLIIFFLRKFNLLSKFLISFLPVSLIYEFKTTLYYYNCNT